MSNSLFFSKKKKGFRVLALVFFFCFSIQFNMLKRNKSGLGWYKRHWDGVFRCDFRIEEWSLILIYMPSCETWWDEKEMKGKKLKVMETPCPRKKEKPKKKTKKKSWFGIRYVKTTFLVSFDSYSSLTVQRDQGKHG